jgi:bacillaene biosynthesis, polyketide synthase / nonribosomal peptide synthetase PksN/BaeN
MIHSQGRALLSERRAAPRIDLTSLQDRCGAEVLTAAQCYAALNDQGLVYGPGHRGLMALRVGADATGGRFVLARLALPQSVAGTHDDYLLHPSILDGALQASIGLGPNGDSEPSLPFALDTLEIYGPSSTHSYAIIRETQGGSQKIDKLDIDLCDEQGVVSARLRGVARRVFTGEAGRREEQRVGEVEQAPEVDERTGISTVVVSDLLEAKAVQFFKKLLASNLKLPLERIEADAPLEKYGIDSILVMQITSELEKLFGSLSKTLLFEYQDLESLTRYFVETHREQMIKALWIEEPNLEQAPQAQEQVLLEGRLNGSIKTPSQRRRFAARSRKPLSFSEGASRDIAIIGVSGRYPQANNLDEYWENLKTGKDGITEIPPERWDYRLYFDPQKDKIGKSYSKWGGFIDGVDQFDPLFFNISPREAIGMDPQERLFLQCCYETIEDAGYTRESLKDYRALGLDGNVGVFVGVMYEEYQLYAAQAQALGKPYALYANPSSIANRVSYFCNFHGPSMAIDTMCSSSLTAIHLACQSLINGGCELAIAGGVNVSVHPNKYLGLSQGQFASSVGRCESFGEGGDGYVPGEGVGAVLLRPLDRAVADGDYIYGVIKGTSINHNGKTNGYTVPNPNAQARVIAQALKDSKIDARTVSYIEAHGTGTSLGDPIEIAGLSKAFQAHTADKQFCAIGSVKSNIGHCESAAGIAGVTKVLLQLKHRTLAPSLHAETLNPHIDFANSPFVVKRELGEWRRPVLKIDGQEREYPRIAGVSSFGAGGANAHVLIEEYIAPQSNSQRPIYTITPTRPAIILLSAKSEDRLEEQVRQLLRAVETGRFKEEDLTDLAYTLQVGREAMEQRLAFTTTSIEDLKEKLTHYLKSKNEIDDLYRGEVKRGKETLAVFSADEELQEAIGKWAQRGKYGKLLDLWVKGLAFDWRQLYPESKPRRVSLPTYPFAKERYWIPVNDSMPANHEAPAKTLNGGTNTFVLHPLVHRNTSSLSGLRFSSTFTGREFFLADHQVNGERVLPGVAYLEMARVAVQEAIKDDVGNEQPTIQLKHVAWSRPVVVGDEAITVHLALYPEDGGEISYEIYSLDPSGEAIIHSQGRAALAEAGQAPRINVRSLEEQHEAKVLTAAQCYAAFEGLGLVYGSGHRGLTALRVGADETGARFVLARLGLPQNVAGTRNDYLLHPSLLDGALQASIGLRLSDGDASPSLPFALDAMEIYGPCSTDSYAVVRESMGSGEKTHKLDIDLCDKQGLVRVRLRGFTTRELTVEPDERAKQGIDTILLERKWQAKGLSASQPVYAQHWALIDSILQERLPERETQSAGIKAILLAEHGQGLAERFNACAEQVFGVVQRILRDKPKGEVLLQALLSRENQHAGFFGALSGLLKSASQENPRLITQVIEAEAAESAAGLIEMLKDNARGKEDREIRYQRGERQVASLSELSTTDKPVVIPWRKDGVYLITGGAGGLGLIFAREILSRVKDPRLILTGRSSPSGERQRQLESLQSLSPGAEIEYRQLDVGDAAAVKTCIQELIERHGRLDGVLHSAGVIHDSFLLKKTVEELRFVLSPKVSGLINLDEATARLPLDFLVAFSSAAAVFGNVGQGDYATANAFMDRYAEYRNGLVKAGSRRGRTLSINWPLWESGGMQVDVATLERMRASVGIVPLSTEQGIEAFYQSLGTQKSQVVALAGEVARLAPMLGKEEHVLFEENLYSDLFEKTLNGVLSENDFRELLLNKPPALNLKNSVTSFH